MELLLFLVSKYKWLGLESVQQVNKVHYTIFDGLAVVM